ncbi:MAG: glucose-6-phosphate isomerase, partial [Gammaproteobacteria bacterium]|nr:glucose-6-phosphate isomerase [Gammaproteobacteria bacterium]
MNSITDSSAWGSLQIHWSTLKNLHMRELFAKDSDRFSRFSLQVDDFFLDFSKNRITTQTLELLLQLAQEVGLSQEIHRMFEGEKINFTEHRAVLHTALRNRSGEPVCVDNENVMPEVHGVLERMGVFATKVRSGEWQGYSAKRITDVVNIGIGGSDLGPKMVTEALRPFSSGDLNMHFVSNVDGADLGAVLQRLDPETSLFIVTSKTFTTQETMANANSARQWFLSHHN